MPTETHNTAYVEAPPGSLRDGLTDLVAGIRSWPNWLTLTWYGIRSQYRRTYLGPWWMTLQMAIFAAGLSLLFGVLFGQDLSFFVPYVTIGFACFQWMTGMISSGSTSIIAHASAIHTSPQPISIHTLRGVATATIQFAHDAVVIVAVVILFKVTLTWSVIIVPFVVVLILVNGLAVGLWLGPLVARYRDIEPIVASLIRVLFFFTPVFWVATDLSAQQQAWISGWNPLAYLLEAFRTPLLGSWPTALTLTVCVGVTIVNVIIGILIASRARTRVAYWV